MGNVILVAVNLDPHHRQSGWVRLDLEELGVDSERPYLMHDLLRGGDRFIWKGERNYIELDPNVLPAHISRLGIRLRRETDFDYFM